MASERLISPARMASTMALNSFSGWTHCQPCGIHLTASHGAGFLSNPGASRAPARTALVIHSRHTGRQSWWTMTACWTISQRRRNSSSPARIDE